MEKVEKLKDLFKPVFENGDVRLFDLKWISGKENILEVSIIKKDGSMDLDTCADVSEKLSTILDESDFMNDEYTLEVCSPGAEREIKDVNEFDSLVGEYVYVRLKEPFKKSLEFTGEVLSVIDGEITLDYRDKAAHRKAIFKKENIDFARLAVKI